MGSVRRPTDPYPCDIESGGDAQRLRDVFDVLDNYLGDTDPHTDIPWDEWEEDDLKVEQPLIWCCRQLSRMIERKRKLAR